MLTIRLTRKGKKNQPFFRVIVIDKKRTAKGGNAVEIVGNVDPLTKKRNFKKDRILYWISKGAKPTPSVHNLLVSEKIIDAKKINVSKKPKKPAESAATPAASETKPAEEAKIAPAVTASATPALEVKPVEPEKPAEEPKVEPASAEASASANAPAGQAGVAKEEKPAQ